jgi:hypothetical protein
MHILFEVNRKRPVLYCRRERKVSPTMELKLMVYLYQISYFAKKITKITNEISKLAQRGLVQNCRGDRKSRPDNRHA